MASSETDFLRAYDAAAFARPSVAVDLVLMSMLEGAPAVLLMRRGEHPGQGLWALPGGFVGIAEDLDAAAARVLREKARLDGAFIEQLYTFGAPDRDPRTRVITIAYFALLPTAVFTKALDAIGDLALARVKVPWGGEAGVPIEIVGKDGVLPLAFDHAQIIATAIKRLRGKLDYSAIAFALLPELFTLRALQDVHEAILGVTLNKPAFRRRMLDKGWLTPTGAREAGTSYRPAELYRHDPSSTVKGE